VQLILVFVVILLQEVLVNLGEVMKVEGTPGVDAFMDAEELPVFLGDEGVAAVRACKAKRRGDNIAGDKGLSTDFALVLSVAAIVVVEVVVRCPTKRTEDIFRDGFSIAALNGCDRFAVFPEIVLQKELPILFDERFDEREAVGGELLVLRGVGIIEGPLSEGKISADEIQEAADSIILFLNYSK
jgi:hypothetical protein